MIKGEFTIERKLINDTIKQLNVGQKCYFYNKEMLKDVEELLIKRYNKKLIVKEVKDYYVLSTEGVGE